MRREKQPMFLTSYFLGEGNKEKKKIAEFQQCWEDKYPNKYVSNQACASNILADVKFCTNLAAYAYRKAQQGIQTCNPLSFAEIPDWCGELYVPITLVRYVDALTQGKYDGTPIQKLVTAAKEPHTFDYDGEHITFDAIVDALIAAQDIALISLYIAEPLNLNYRQKQLDLPRPGFVRAFINNGGDELVEALYNGCAIEDIISLSRWERREQ